MLAWFCIEQSSTTLYIEEFALALRMALRKLRPYFQAYKIEVLTDQPLRNIIYSPKASGRLVKWAIELGEFDIKYKASDGD